MSRHLTPEQLVGLEAALRQRQRELGGQQARHRDGRSRVEQAREMLLQDGDDAPQRDADREIDLAVSDREVVELAAIGQALQRLADGHYGRCVDCGAEVPLARLQLEPHALRCVACESARERGQSRPASM